MKGRQKIQLSKRVGDEIIKKQFEEEMPRVFQALQKAWELAF
jgi:hypothetical protein